MPIEVSEKGDNRGPKLPDISQMSSEVLSLRDQFDLLHEEIALRLDPILYRLVSSGGKAERENAIIELASAKDTLGQRIFLDRAPLDPTHPITDYCSQLQSLLDGLSYFDQIVTPLDKIVIFDPAHRLLDSHETVLQKGGFPLQRQEVSAEAQELSATKFIEAIRISLYGPIQNIPPSLSLECFEHARLYSSRPGEEQTFAKHLRRLGTMVEAVESCTDLDLESCKLVKAKISEVVSKRPQSFTTTADRKAVRLYKKTINHGDLTERKITSLSNEARSEYLCDTYVRLNRALSSISFSQARFPKAEMKSLRSIVANAVRIHTRAHAFFDDPQERAMHEAYLNDLKELRMLLPDLPNFSSVRDRLNFRDNIIGPVTKLGNQLSKATEI